MTGSMTDNRMCVPLPRERFEGATYARSAQVAFARLAVELGGECCTLDELYVRSEAPSRGVTDVLGLLGVPVSVTRRVSSKAPSAERTSNASSAPWSRHRIRSSAWPS